MFRTGSEAVPDSRRHVDGLALLRTSLERAITALDFRWSDMHDHSMALIAFNSIRGLRRLSPSENLDLVPPSVQRAQCGSL